MKNKYPMGILYKKIVFYNCMLFFLFQFSIRANSQVVESFNLNKFSKDSISQFIIQFWKNTHDINTDFEINSRPLKSQFILSLYENKVEN
jgi:hypothetical protein